MNSFDSFKSRYSVGGITEVSKNGLMHEWWHKKYFAHDSSDIAYVLEENYAFRPDLVAIAFYGDPRLQWFVMQYNKIIDVTTEFVPGLILTLPTLDRMQQLLSTRTNGTSSTRVLTPGIEVL